MFPSFTAVTVPVRTPPKKPLPVIFIVTVARFEPVFGLTLPTTGAAVVTVYLSAAEAALAPNPAVATVTS